MKENKKSFKLGLPLKLAIIVIACFLFGDFITPTIKSFFYSISLTIKDLLIFVLPLIVFSYIFSCILSLKQRSWVFVGLILVALTASNFFSTLIAYTVSKSFFNIMGPIEAMQLGAENALAPLWKLSLPRLIPNDVALFSGLILGALFSIFRNKTVEKISINLKNLSNLLLHKGLVPVVPLFIFGFVLNLQSQGLLQSMFSQYGTLLACIVSTQLSYIAILFLINSGFSPKKWLISLRNVLPSAIAGFSTMSSAAAMPLTLRGAEKNTGDPDKADAIIPITVNIHLIGDSIGIPIIALGIIHSFGLPAPDMSTYLIFATFFVIAKFAVAAVPGGGILVMLPVLEKYLNFTPDMLSLITALYILFDMFFTTANVLGNGAFAVLYIRFYKWISREKSKKTCE
ncbi:MAG: transporter [Verrucomicrobia bacterium CG_4_10_14_3_um_filter_43_23]|nr:MAG: hypothetical protein AUJ82_08190 [Verrucomicrobia bacterium CG1_02_43_26]PIP59950.1 MAG: transporter [Verrucomicrobia bacterium CG22_combo_CG10-13_8_21_14_all_43_17]PIX58140.1 MAG: transporter [Verrucomicrobia bacterium CG_4_10_14_3_um_filter_43_23]PIY61861.1 MAG: transporter [Verrucomicrobia bacterium CG_4_10_14_0_8_um_filter_43_34]PJA44482.1 MAG: transporter [Verrucomicrobia bacterium CG_4_9_14_3_um_filter_43_20]